MSPQLFGGRGAGPSLAEELDPRVLAALGSVGEARRSARRHAAGRAALMVAAASARESLRGSGAPPGLRWRRRFAVVALSFAGLNLGGAGLAALAAGAMPDSPLYAVKRAAEAADLSLTFDPVDKARLQLEIADRRAEEANVMAHSGRPDLALAAARDATTLVQQAGATLLARPSVANSEALEHASAEARARLLEVFAALESGSDPGAAVAARSLEAMWHGGLGNAPSGGRGSPPGAAGGAPGATGQGSGGGGQGGSGAAHGGPPSAHPTPPVGRGGGHPGSH